MHDGRLGHELNQIMLLFAWDLDHKGINGRCVEAGETPIHAVCFLLDIGEERRYVTNLELFI